MLTSRLLSLLLTLLIELYRIEIYFQNEDINGDGWLLIELYRIEMFKVTMFLTMLIAF